MDIKNLRKDYKKSKIDFHNIVDDPMFFFMNWFEEALKKNKEEANACVLSTVNSKGDPSSRVILLKEVTVKGFVFFTNYNSKKGRDINNNNNVSINFYWPNLERQVRITGIAAKISVEESDIYFKNRPRNSQIATWFSEQSSLIEIDSNCSEILNSIKNKFNGKKVERPKYWGGYCVSPNRIEFWQGRPSRLHDRLVYTLVRENWESTRIAP